jgi:hypothetical protein
MEPSESRASASLLALTANIANMQRLLNRRGDDGALVPADADLIRVAIGTVREEADSVAKVLAALPNDPTSVGHGSVTTMLKAVANINVVLDMLTDAVSRLNG